MQIKKAVFGVIALLMFLAGATSCHTTNRSAEANGGDNGDTEQKSEARENIPTDTDMPEDDAAHDATKARELIIGKWEWEKTICCSRKPEVIKGDTADKLQFLEFKKDSMVVFYKGEDVQKRKEYRVKEGTLVPNMPEIEIEGQRTGILRITKDQLVLDYSYIDLQTEYYRKVK